MTTGMTTVIQPTASKDFPFTETMTREAFWNLYRPGSVEHLILHNLRNSTSYCRELDLTAHVENKVVGHIISSKAKVVDVHNKEHEILCVGPLSVLPGFQKKGIGSALMNHSILVAKQLGFSGMILFGNPDYYHRFGFRNALEYGITTKEGQNFEPFMALELQVDGLTPISGRFMEDSAFEVQPEDIEAFEKNFPYKEKKVTDTQLNNS
jgi:predicted N-acetyltransferase YhbS